MVIEAHGENADHTLSQYVGPTRIVEKRGRVIVYDAGSDTVIAELTEEAARAVRSGRTSKLSATDGKIILEPTPDADA
jgi:hypothetical protein